MTDVDRPDPPSPFIERWVRRLAPEWPRGSRALDVACGRGRHVVVLARAGFRVVGIDVRLDALQSAAKTTRGAALAAAFVCADLTGMPLPVGRFHVIVVCRYLDRAFFPALREALVPGGVLLYETFTERQLQYARGPRSRAHLLRPGELRGVMHGLDVLFDEEVTEPDAVARIAARKLAPSRPRHVAHIEGSGK